MPVMHNSRILVAIVVLVLALLWWLFATPHQAKRDTDLTVVADASVREETKATQADSSDRTPIDRSLADDEDEVQRVQIVSDGSMQAPGTISEFRFQESSTSWSRIPGSNRLRV